MSTTTDLWSVDQTKAAFFGLTAHWIRADPESGKWTLHIQVVAFKGISGAHTGDNLGRYFVSLCERAGIIAGRSSKVRESATISLHSTNLHILFNSYFASRQTIQATMILHVSGLKASSIAAKSTHSTQLNTAFHVLPMLSIWP